MNKNLELQKITFLGLDGDRLVKFNDRQFHLFTNLNAVENYRYFRNHKYIYKLMGIEDMSSYVISNDKDGESIPYEFKLKDVKSLEEYRVYYNISKKMVPILKKASKSRFFWDLKYEYKISIVVSSVSGLVIAFGETFLQFIFDLVKHFCLNIKP